LKSRRQSSIWRLFDVAYWPFATLYSLTRDELRRFAVATDEPSLKLSSSAATPMPAENTPSSQQTGMNAQRP
jgi:hypothetical protein